MSIELDFEVGEPTRLKYWIGFIDEFSEIREVYSYDHAQKYDFHHQLYFSPASVEKIDNAEGTMFWLNEPDKVENWGSPFSKDQIKAIKKFYQDRNTSDPSSAKRNPGGIKDSLLTVLSYGAGQDSTALLLMYIHDVDNFRERFAPDDFIVVMSDTGNEFPETDEYREYIEDVCEDNDIPFYFLECGGKYHSPSFPSLVEFYNRTKTCGSKAFPKTCTDRLKIKPIYKFLNEYVAEEYDYEAEGGVYRGKKALVDFAREYGKINVMLGIAYGEEKRVGDEITGIKWMDLSIRRIYPLIPLKMDRQACQDMVEDLGYEVPWPSNCMMCPFLNDIELLWLYREFPAAYRQWVKIEQAKIDNNLHMGDKNLGVWGRKLLPEKLEEVQEKYGHMSDDELDEYRFSHGHCLTTRY